MKGLFTLADIPELDAGRRTTIAVARIGELWDPRYGRFAIKQSEVDGWKRNLSSTFGGRVSIDYDHSSDRGGGTKAAAWITGLHQQGELVTADVEFTPAGAKSVRDGDYLYISPTFVRSYLNEHGQKCGPALLGAALTNRPVLRKGMPTLSLSKSGATLMKKEARKLKKAKKRKKLARKRAAEFTLSQHTLAQLVPYSPALAAMVGQQPVRTLARRPAPSPGSHRVPPGLDAEGQRLHAEIGARSASTGEDYFTAMGDVTGNPAYAQRSDVPPDANLQGLDAERAGMYHAGRVLARTAGVSWQDALHLLDGQRAVTEAENHDVSSSVPWLDGRILSTPPRPWAPEDWQRDQRRAQAHGVDISHEYWKAAAEEGHDAVGHAIAERRSARTAELRGQHAGQLEEAMRREDERRAEAIDQELRRRAATRLGVRVG